MPEFAGFSHLSLTVSDLERSERWYGDVLGWKSMMQETDGDVRWAFGYLPGGVGLSLHQHSGGPTDAFSPARPGLDHASFAVRSREDLQSWEAHLSGAGAACSSVVDAPYGSVLSFKDPDGIALEAFAPPAS